MRLSVRVAQRLRTRAAGEGGISLLEVVVSLMIIAVVMTSAAGFFLNGLKATGGASARQQAVNITNAELENIRAVPPSSLLQGRVQTGSANNSLQPLFAYSGAGTLTQFDDTTNTHGGYNYDTATPPAPTPTVPTFTTQSIAGQAFKLYNFIDPCWVNLAKGQSADLSHVACGATYSPSTTTTTTSMLYRITVATTWKGGASTQCTQGCAYSASTLVDPNKDPTFNSNISGPAITGISPSSIPVGTTTTVIISGSDFRYGATVTTCGGATAVVDQSNLTATSAQVNITAGSSPVASCQLVFTNPDGGNAITTFAISPGPAITTGPGSVQNYRPSQVTILGTNFVEPRLADSGSGAGQWGTPSVTGAYGSPQTLTVGYTANAPVGLQAFTLTNLDGGQTTGTISVTPSMPVIDSVSAPSPLTAGSSTNQITITGSDFASSNVKVTVPDGWGTIGQVTSSFSSVSFNYAAPSSGGPVTFTVTNPDNGSVQTSLNVSAPAIPTIASVITHTKGSGCFFSLCNSWTTTFTVTGTNFGSGPVVIAYKVGGSSGTTTVTPSSSTSLTFTYTDTATGWPGVEGTTVGSSYAFTVTTSAGTSNPATTGKTSS